MIEQFGQWLIGLLRSDNVILTLLVVPALIVVEMAWPARRHPAHHYLFGVAYWLANLAVLSLLAPLIGMAVAVAVRHIDFGLIDLRSLGLPGLPGALLALLVSTLVADFFLYWFHRALHANRYLWQAHLLHHSDEHMNVMTAQRSHFMELVLSPLFVALPMAIFFQLPPVTIALLSPLPNAYAFFAHANLNVGFGRLWWLLVSPNYHRIHHSSQPRHYNRNFTNWFPLWDIVFGTVYRPAPDEVPVTGVDGVEVKTLRAAFLLPFVNWYRMWVRGRKATAGPLDRGRRP